MEDSSPESIALADDIALMTLNQLALYLQVDTKTIVQLARKGKIPHYQVGKQFRFLRSAVLQAMLHQPQHVSIPDECTSYKPGSTLLRRPRIGTPR